MSPACGTLYKIAKRFYKTFTMKGGRMEKEKREEIVVLDEGTDTEHMAGPTAFCCRGTLFAFR